VTWASSHKCPEDDDGAGFGGVRDTLLF